uniref:Uncharacterized protein n=1 Tax=Solanum lycopersicum TaxID=4081 RepID=A0A3Q7FDB9_SOLLC
MGTRINGLMLEIEQLEQYGDYIILQKLSARSLYSCHPNSVIRILQLEQLFPNLQIDDFMN